MTPPLIRAFVLTGTGLLVAAGVAGCQAEPRPAAGSVKAIGSPNSASVSVSGATGSVSGTGARPAVGVSPSPAASPGAPTAGDGIYRPVSNVDGYLFVSTDLADISRLTNAVLEGKPLPSQDILEIYEKGKNSRTATGFRTLRGFARAEDRAKQFPTEVAFYQSPTFLDDPVYDAIQGTGSAANYSPAQRRQAIQKGLQRILKYYILHEMMAAEGKVKEGNVAPDTGAPHNVDEAWALYMGAPVDGKYPNSLSATAQSREANYKREGTIDQPLRQAFERAKSAAAARDQAGFEAAKKDVESRLNAIFYLASARYLNEALKNVEAGKPADAAPQLIEGFAFYQSIQPLVAKADPEADRTLVAYYKGDPSTLTRARRDEALAALNRTTDALGLRAQDRLSPADYS